MPPTIKQIADGSPFDATTAIRLLCRYITDVENPLGAFPSDPDKLPDIPPPVIQSLLPPKLVDLLLANGYATPAEISAATDDQLLAIDGIGDKSLTLIRAALHA